MAAPMNIVNIAQDAFDGLKLVIHNTGNKPRAVAILPSEPASQPTPEGDLRAVHRWRDGRWQRCRMYELRKDDVFRVEGERDCFVATEDGYKDKDGTSHILRALPCVDPLLTRAEPTSTLTPSNPLATLQEVLSRTLRPKLARKRDSVDMGIDKGRLTLQEAHGQYWLAGAFTSGYTVLAGDELAARFQLDGGGVLQFDAVATNVLPLTGLVTSVVTYESRGDVTITHADGTSHIIRALPCVDPLLTRAKPASTLTPSNPLATLREVLSRTLRPKLARKRDSLQMGIEKSSPGLRGSHGQYWLESVFTTNHLLAVGDELTAQFPLNGGGELQFDAVVTHVSMKIVTYESRGDVTITHADGTIVVIR